MHFERSPAAPGVVRIEVSDTPAPAMDTYTAGWLAAATEISHDAPITEQACEPEDVRETESDGYHYAHADKDTLWQQGRDGTGGFCPSDAPNTDVATAADIQVDSQGLALCIRIAGEMPVRLQGERPTPAFFGIWKRHKALLKSAGVFLIKEDGCWKVRCAAHTPSGSELRRTRKQVSENRGYRFRLFYHCGWQCWYRREQLQASGTLASAISRAEGHFNEVRRGK